MLLIGDEAFLKEKRNDPRGARENKQRLYEYSRFASSGYVSRAQLEGRTENLTPKLLLKDRRVPEDLFCEVLRLPSQTHH